MPEKAYSAGLLIWALSGTVPFLRLTNSGIYFSSSECDPCHHHQRVILKSSTPAYLKSLFWAWSTGNKSVYEHALNHQNSRWSVSHFRIDSARTETFCLVKTLLQTTPF